jgi:hypothetical protein
MDENIKLFEKQGKDLKLHPDAELYLDSRKAFLTLEPGAILKVGIRGENFEYKLDEVDKFLVEVPNEQEKEN